MPTRNKDVLVGILLAGLLAVAGAVLPALEPPNSGDKKDPAEPKCDLAVLKHVQRCGGCGSDIDGSECKCGKSKDCKCKARQKKDQEECIKVYYECTECQNQQFRPGKCEKDGKKVEEKTDKADVIFVCENCGARAKKAGSCEKCKGKLIKTCEKSGRFPHVPAK